MRIVVPIKQVPETNAVKMDEETGTMIREGVEAIINPLDLYAIEIAIRLAAAHGGRTVAVSMGPPKAASALREAVAMGIDAAVLISDKAFAGSDTWATSYVLAAAIRKLEADGFPAGPAGAEAAEAQSRRVRVAAGAGDPVGQGPADLIVCGERATDGDTGQVGPGMAAWLGRPVATYVSRVDSVSGGRVRVHRLVEDGYEVLDVQTPAVLTVVKEVAEPGLPTLRGKQKAKRMDLPTWGADDLDVEEQSLGLNGSPTRVVRIFRPQVARECEMLRATDEAGVAAAADRLAAFLQERDLL